MNNQLSQDTQGTQAHNAQALDVQGLKYLWLLPAGDTRQIGELAAKYNLAYPVAHTLLSRGFTTGDMLDSYLFSTYEKDVAHASKLKGAPEAVARILRAIDNKEKILVFGDYDVDGITSSALMMICLLPLGAQVNFFLPHRVRDGYGLSTKIVERAASNGYTVIITVDNGITAYEPAKRAKELGIDLIITDHHRPHEQMPDAMVIVNPHQPACTYPFKYFAGVGVTFKILSLLYEQKQLELPVKAYELLLLGTVADVVPLTGENRFWVRHGLLQINKVESLSLKVLKKNGKVTKPQITSTDIGFSITPQINALGRLQDARQGVKFLIGSDIAEVQEVGTILLELNEARKEIERSIFAQVQQEIESGRIDLAKENIIIAASKGWQPGVIGLVASRIVSAYGKPTILLHLTDQGIAKGSCRSIAGFDMFHALEHEKELLIQFGGHAMAAGLALKISDIPALKQALETRIAGMLTPYDLKQKIVCDAQLSLSDADQKLLEDMHYLQPFGNENSEPLFYIKEVMLAQPPTMLKDLHVKCTVFADGVTKSVIFFNRPELFEQLRDWGDKTFDLAVRVSENHWNGRVSIELMGVDIAFN